MSKSAQIVIRLPPDVLDELRVAAGADSRSVSSAVLAAIRAWLASHRELREGQP